MHQLAEERGVAVIAQAPAWMPDGTKEWPRVYIMIRG